MSTPGPMYSCPMGRVYRESDGHAVAQCETPHKVEYAVLFAAAPEMADKGRTALAVFHAYTQGESSEGELLTAMQALDSAIAKAEGRCLNHKLVPSASGQYAHCHACFGTSP